MPIELIRKALDRAGYENDEPTETNLRLCFEDYVDSGYFRDLTMTEARRIDVERIVKRMARI